MIKVEFIRWCDVTEKDARYIAKGCLSDCFFGGPEELVARAMDGEVGLYRVTGDAEGLIVTSVDKDKLHIEMLSGIGFVSNFNSIHDEILRIALSAGLRKVSGFVRSKALARLYDQKTLGRQTALYYEEEIA